MQVDAKKKILDASGEDKTSASKDKTTRLFARAAATDWKRLIFMFLGILSFAVIYLSSPWPDALEPGGERVTLTHEGKAALAVFMFTAIWWVFEVLPIGVTAIAVGALQVLFQIRPANEAFTDFMDPSVWFIFGSLVIGMVFTKTGLTKRMAYKMLVVVGERTSVIYLGCFLLTAALTLIMAHTAVAATVFPLLMAIYALYEEDNKPTRFGKGLFMGMAFTAGAGSIITLLGAARGAIGISFYRELVGDEITFFQLSYYMLPLGVLMVFLLWIFFVLFFRPEKKMIPGLRQRARTLYARLGPVTPMEWLTLIIVLAVLAAMISSSFISPDSPLKPSFNKSAIILTATILFFIFRILNMDDLEDIPWNIILLFGGAMSIGFCLWETGAARWMALKWLVLFQAAPRFWFIMSIAFLVLIMTNLIMNVAAIAITLPVAIVMAQYLGVSPQVILFVSLAAAGMPFLFLIGAAPNAIAYGSNQFTSGEFFKAGIPASLLLLVVLALFVWFVWPMMGMPVFIQ